MILELDELDLFLNLPANSEISLVEIG